jgi:hypothetical protein
MAEPPLQDDPFDEEELRAVSDAWKGMLRGDLEPLATYLQAGYELHPIVRQDLIDGIRGEFAFGFYTLKLEKNPLGPGTALDVLRLAERELQIWQHVQEQLFFGANRKTAIQSAKEKFGIGRSTIENSLASFERRRGGINDFIRDVFASRKSKRLSK